VKSHFTQIIHPYMRILSDDQIEAIHLAGCEILEHTGSKILNKKAQELLHGFGAHIGPNNIVRIPSWLVNDAIRKAPERIVLCNRDGRRTMFLEGHNCYFGCNPDEPDYLDPYTGKRRPFTSKDGRDMARVVDYTDNIDFVLTGGFCADVDAKVADRVIIREMILNQRKVIGFSCKDADSLLDIMEMGSIVAGGHEELEMNPYLFHIQESISPLVHDDNSIKELMICAEKNFPIVYYPMPMAGTTAPTTFAGVLALNLAETLTGLVIHQLTKPGAPIILGGVPSIMDMRTMRYAYGAPELHLQCSALSEIIHHYKIPFWGTAGCVETATIDQQAAAEISVSCLMAALSGANLVHDTGLMDQATVTCPEILLLADEIQDLIKHIMKGIDVNEETLALDMVHKVGPGGNFLAEDHTLKHFRSFWNPRLFSRQVMQPGESGPSLSERLNKKAKEIIETHQVPPLAEDKRKALLQLEKKWLG
jgi:trimethylamine--corrinoid protein Co-methyltransferase